MGWSTQVHCSHYFGTFRRQGTITPPQFALDVFQTDPWSLCSGAHSKHTADIPAVGGRDDAGMLRMNVKESGRVHALYPRQVQCALNNSNTLVQHCMFLCLFIHVKWSVCVSVGL